MSALAARRLYIVAYCMAAAALVWLIVSAAVSGELAQHDPALALRWRPHNPSALVELAQTSLSEQRPADARSYASEAVAHGPHDATAWRLLGQAALAESHRALAQQLFIQAGKLTQRDATLAAWFFEDALRKRQYDDAVRYADVIIRRAPDKQGAMMFRMTALAHDPAAVPALAQALAQRPVWRTDFFRELASSSTNSDVAEQLLERMISTAVPLEPAELSPLLVQMVNDKRVDEAYRLWLASLPSGEKYGGGLVYDPTFLPSRAPGPFGWTLYNGEDDEIRFATAAEQPGLRITFHGRKAQQLAIQRLMLAPGRYRLASSGTLLEGQEELLNWIIGCPGVPSVLLDLRKGAPAFVSSEFVVLQDCVAPVLLLRSIGREGDGSASAVIDHVTIEKIG